MKKKKRTSSAKQQSKHSERPETTPREPLITSQVSTPKRLISLFWKVFAGFAVILGVFAAIYPKVSVNPSTYLDPHNPLKTLYKITNNGLIPIRDVKISCAIRKIVRADRPGVIGAPDYSSQIFNPTHVSKEISSGESDTAFCAFGALDLHSSVESVDLAVIVDFSVFGIHWPDKIFPFTTQKDVMGALHLIPHPLKK